MDTCEGSAPVWFSHGSCTAVDGVGHGRSVFVETPPYVYTRAAARLVLRTAFEAGRIVAAKGGVVVHPEDWRKWLTGKRSPSDAEIKVALAARLVLPKRSNNHARDACGVALYGLHLLGAL